MRCSYNGGGGRFRGRGLGRVWVGRCRSLVSLFFFFLWWFIFVVVVLTGAEYSPGEFVYTTNPGGGSSATNGNGNGNGSSNSRESSSPPANLPLTRPVDPFSSLSSEHKSLLHHFIHDASQITACHSGMQTDICKMLIPMALQTPSLLYATTALSAIHLQAVNNRSETVKSAPEIARFMALSLEHFRNELQNPSTRGSDALLATARTLCLAEIHSGAIHPNSWRAHIEGARVLMGTTAGSGGESAEGFRWYLYRWYRSIVSLTALTGNGPPIGGVVADQQAESNAIPPEDPSPDYLDDYWGFTVHLSAIFRGIGAAAWRRHQNRSLMGGDAIGEDISVQNDASSLESSVHHLMDRGAGSLPTFYPGVAEALSPACINEFILCNEAFQHSALIQIHRRLRKTPTSSPAVQASVKRILECTEQIGPSSGLSPWVMLTTPLFIAGCEAREVDRERVRELLALLHDSIRVPNVLQSLKFLEQYWANQMDEEEDWSHFLGRFPLSFVLIMFDVGKLTR